MKLSGNAPERLDTPERHVHAPPCCFPWHYHADFYAGMSAAQHSLPNGYVITMYPAEWAK